ncbi:hypothetical protein HDU76_007863 [Blyttiomyces sp. JEL0837]|nr:hypothetical protein HDU76_007863 [Blyttiomyces sp. JEL0837]
MAWDPSGKNGVIMDTPPAGDIRMVVCCNRANCSRIGNVCHSTTSTITDGYLFRRKSTTSSKLYIPRCPDNVSEEWKTEFVLFVITIRCWVGNCPGTIFPVLNEDLPDGGGDELDDDEPEEEPEEEGNNP